MSSVKGHGFTGGVHWMQRPENKARVAKLIKRMHRAKKLAKRKPRVSRLERFVAKRVKQTRAVAMQNGHVESQESAIVVNGWRAVLRPDCIIITRDE